MPEQAAGVTAPQISMTVRVVSGVVVVASGGRSPTDEEWANFMEVLDQAPNANVLVVAGKRRVGPAQRAALRDRLTKNSRQLALVTSSTMARGVGIALSWFTDRVRVFGPADFQEAVGHVGMDPASLDAVIALVKETRSRIPDIPVLPGE